MRIAGRAYSIDTLSRHSQYQLRYCGKNMPPLGQRDLELATLMRCGQFRMQGSTSRYFFSDNMWAKFLTKTHVLRDTAEGHPVLRALHTIHQSDAQLVEETRYLRHTVCTHQFSASI